MFSLVYVSRPLLGTVDRPDMLDDLQAVSTARNSALDITGLLIATPQYFAELLEGPARSVEIVMASILADSRHYDVRMVRESTVEKGRFKSWQMVRFNTSNIVDRMLDAILAAGHEQRDTQLACLFESIAMLGAWSRG